MTVIAGATAVGGGDFTVVVLVEVVSEVLLLVESVTIGSTAHVDVVITKSTAARAIFLFI
jgi:hypothetical protein